MTQRDAFPRESAANSLADGPMTERIMVSAAEPRETQNTGGAMNDSMNSSWIEVERAERERIAKERERLVAHPTDAEPGEDLGEESLAIHDVGGRKGGTGGESAGNLGSSGRWGHL